MAKPKPQRWPLKPQFVAKPWRSYWEKMAVCLPFWEGRGTHPLAWTHTNGWVVMQPQYSKTITWDKLDKDFAANTSATGQGMYIPSAIANNLDCLPWAATPTTWFMHGYNDGTRSGNSQRIFVPTGGYDIVGRADAANIRWDMGGSHVELNTTWSGVNVAFAAAYDLTNLYMRNNADTTTGTPSYGTTTGQLNLGAANHFDNDYWGGNFSVFYMFRTALSAGLIDALIADPAGPLREEVFFSGYAPAATTSPWYQFMQQAGD